MTELAVNMTVKIVGTREKPYINKQGEKKLYYEAKLDTGAIVGISEEVYAKARKGLDLPPDTFVKLGYIGTAHESGGFDMLDN